MLRGYCQGNFEITLERVTCAQCAVGYRNAVVNVIKIEQFRRGHNVNNSEN